MENENKKGLFYGVIGVATLIVTIIGATFAYFSATVNPNSAINGNIASVGGLVLTVTGANGTDNYINMIPVNFMTNTNPALYTDNNAEDQYSKAVGILLFK